MHIQRKHNFIWKGTRPIAYKRMQFDFDWQFPWFFNKEQSREWTMNKPFYCWTNEILSFPLFYKFHNKNWRILMMRCLAAIKTKEKQANFPFHSHWHEHSSAHINLLSHRQMCTATFRYCRHATCHFVCQLKQFCLSPFAHSVCIVHKSTGDELVLVISADGPLYAMLVVTILVDMTVSGATKSENIYFCHFEFIGDELLYRTVPYVSQHGNNLALANIQTKLHEASVLTLNESFARVNDVKMYTEFINIRQRRRGSFGAAKQRLSFGIGQYCVVEKGMKEF